MHTEVLSVLLYKSFSSTDNFNHKTDLHEQIIRDFNEHGISFTRVCVDALLNSEKEDEVTLDVTVDNEVGRIAGSESGKDLGTENDENDEAYSSVEKLKVVEIATAVLKRHKRLNTDIQKINPVLLGCVGKQCIHQKGTISDHLQAKLTLLSLMAKPHNLHFNAAARELCIVQGNTVPALCGSQVLSLEIPGFRCFSLHDFVRSLFRKSILPSFLPCRIPWDHMFVVFGTR